MEKPRIEMSSCKQHAFIVLPSGKWIGPFLSVGRIQRELEHPELTRDWQAVLYSKLQHITTLPASDEHVLKLIEVRACRHPSRLGNN